LYANGLLTHTGTGNPNSPSGSTKIAGVQGNVDEAKYFDTYRDQAEVAWSYNRGAPQGWWKLDECQGNQAYDSSGNGNTGTITIGGSGSNTSLGTCSSGTGTEAWNNGTTGMRSASLDLDGQDDLISMGDVLDQTTNDFTISTWAKRADTDTWLVVASKGGTTEPSFFFSIQDTTDVLRFITRDSDSQTIADSTTTIGDTNWHHIAVVADRDANATFYIDGQQKESIDISSDQGSLANADAFEIGRSRDQASYSNGQIDDVKIFNYALTPQQILTEYNQGAVHFGN
jgi:hypothetical protein